MPRNGKRKPRAMVVTLYGRCGKDAARFQSKAGNEGVKLRLAAAGVESDGEDRSDVWWTVMAMGEDAGLLEGIEKGEMIKVSGPASLFRFTDRQTGKKGAVWTVFAERVEREEPDESKPEGGDDFGDDIPF